MLKRVILMLLVGSMAVVLCECQLLQLVPRLGGLIPDPTDEPMDGPCAAPPDLPGDLVSFSFSESHSYNARVQGYEFRAENGKYTALFWMANEEEPYPVPVDQAWVDVLTGIVRQNNMLTWDGFSGTDSMLLDGTNFRVSLAFSDGTTVHASGYGRFPAGYGIASEALDAHFMKLLPEDMRGW